MKRSKKAKARKSRTAAARRHVRRERIRRGAGPALTEGPEAEGRETEREEPAGEGEPEPVNDIIEREQIPPEADVEGPESIDESDLPER